MKMPYIYTCIWESLDGVIVENPINGWFGCIFQETSLYGLLLNVMDEVQTSLGGIIGDIGVYPSEILDGFCQQS